MTKLKTKLLLLHLLIVPSILACAWSSPDTANTPEQKRTENKDSAPKTCELNQVKFEGACIDKCIQDSNCQDNQLCDGVGNNRFCVASAPLDCPDSEVAIYDLGITQCVKECTVDERVCGANTQCQHITSTRKGCLAVQTQPPNECDQPNAPARCQATSTSGPMSALSRFGLVHPSDETCCRDFNGDGIADNGVGDSLVFQSTLFAATNEIFSNDLVHIWEHDGIDLDQGGTYTLQMWRGAIDRDGKSTISPTSVIAGSQARYTAQATLTGDQLKATTDLWVFNGFAGVVVPWRMRHVQIEATVDLDKSKKGNGVVLNSGKVSGVLYAEDLLNDINTFAQKNCTCIDTVAGPLRQPIVQFDKDDLKDVRCLPTISTSCDAQDPIEAQCIILQKDTCGLIPIVTELAPDQSKEQLGKDCLDDDLGLKCNAISVGMSFEANSTELSD